MIPLEPLWEQYTRVVKKGRTLVFTATQPFTSMLVMSKPKWFKHPWVWDKQWPMGFQIAKHRPMQSHEDIVVFSIDGDKILYNPQKSKRKRLTKGTAVGASGVCPLAHKDGKIRRYDEKFPESIISFGKKGLDHPTQKPTALIEYLIKTYSNQGDTILDNVIGSGSTAIAAINTGRKFVGIEKDPAFYEVARKRIEQHIRKMKRSFGILNT